MPVSIYPSVIENSAHGSKDQLLGTDRAKNHPLSLSLSLYLRHAPPFSDKNYHGTIEANKGEEEEDDGLKTCSLGNKG